MIAAASAILICVCNLHHPYKADVSAEADSKITNLYISSHSDAQIQQIDSIFNNIAATGNFSGTILIGQKGRVLYRQSAGMADIITKEPITDTTAFQLASVSKQFTAVAVLQLYEQGKLDINEYACTYLPDFPYRNITIKQMLTHRSGLPNYHYLLDRKPMRNDAFFSNQQIISDLIEANEPAYFAPDRRFQYNNTGYAVLAAIVESVSGLKFETYLQQNIFGPLKMSNTFAYRAMKGVSYPPHAIGYVSRRKPATDNYLDHFLGDKGIYSSAADLFKWDQGLYKGIILNPDTLQLAFQPMGIKRRTSGYNYGFGWRLSSFGSDSITIIFHNGCWHGFKTSLIRIPADTTTIVVLRNNSSKVGINTNNILNILYPWATTNYVDSLPDDTEIDSTMLVPQELSTEQ